MLNPPPVTATLLGGGLLEVLLEGILTVIGIGCKGVDLKFIFCIWQQL